MRRSNSWDWDLELKRLEEQKREAGFDHYSDSSFNTCGAYSGSYTNSYNNTRPPHAGHWHPSPLPYSGGGGGGSHHDYYPSPNPSYSTGQMTPMVPERNNMNEPSMATPGRYMSSHDPRQEYFPPDPREWTSNDVRRWIQWASMTFKLRNLHPERFQMNGKALCLMDLSMFMYRVPECGERLYKDFQSRLQKAMCHDNMR